jgi:membrane-associated protein
MALTMRSDLLHWLSDYLIALGPGVLFVACLLETAVFAGLVLPVGALIAFAAMLAARGLMDPGQIIAAALAGALVGDQVGFAVGRWFVTGAGPRAGRITRIWRTALARTEKLVRRRGLLGVSAARGIPFVRTIMPWFAGRSGLSWGRFLLFDTLGVLLWGSIYLGGGFLAGEGWRQVAGRFGETAGVAALIAGAALFFLLSARLARRVMRRRARWNEE